MLKADLHCHTKEDPKGKEIRYDAKELIDHAAILGFEVLAITQHEFLFYPKKIRNYAKKKYILLIPGVEARIKGKDVIILGLKEDKEIKTFRQLARLKRDRDIVVIAPHPFFKKNFCLGKELVRHIKLFDAIEFSHFYCWMANFNNPAVRIAKQYKLPMIGCSDCHALWQMDHTYSMINAKKNISSVLKAIKQSKVRLVTKPLSFYNFLRVAKLALWK